MYTVENTITYKDIKSGYKPGDTFKCGKEDAPRIKRFNGLKITKITQTFGETLIFDLKEWQENYN